MKTAALSEIVKALVHRGIDPQVYFSRIIAGTEVDIVVDITGKLVPIEVKVSATPRPTMASTIKTLQKDLREKDCAPIKKELTEKEFNVN